MKRISIVGCGYTGLRLAGRCLATGYRVRGFATRAASLAQIHAAGAEAIALDLDLDLDLDHGGNAVDFDAHTVFYAVPPNPDGDGDSRLTRWLTGILGMPARIVYLSTTGVYGNRDGGAVDEDTSPAPLSARAHRRVAAEQSLRDWAAERGVSWCILRVPGIYGPGRLPLDRLRRGEPAITWAEATPTNRIHVDDLVTACLAAGLAPCADRRIYNVTDGSDESLTAYLHRVARLANLPPPPLIARARAREMFSSNTWSFLGESRRVGNRRMLAELGVKLAYADIDDGIRASLEAS